MHCSRSIALAVVALTLVTADIGKSLAQALPGASQAVPQLRRAPDGSIEAVPPDAAAAPSPAAEPQSNAPAASSPGDNDGGALANTVGTRYDISADKMPAPRTTTPSDLDPDGVGRPDGAAPFAPKGFTVSIFATSKGGARWLRTAPNGDVFLALSGAGAILLLRDTKGTGSADMITTYADGFSMPHGMAFRNGAFYVADLRGIWRFPYRDGDTKATGAPVRVTAAPDLRPQGWHWTREIAFDRQGQLYLAMGSRGDADADDPPPDASVQMVAADGTMTTFASGLRNVVGMEFSPDTGDLWGTVNERDTLGGGLPPDYLVRIRKGDFFGWPYAYVGPHPDPDNGGKRPDLVAKSKMPDVLFAPHSAPLAIVFYEGTQFPAEYRGDAFVAFHASGPYDKPDGYKVVRVKFKNGMPAGGYEDFLTGWMFAGTNPPHIWGTPAGLTVAKDGSLLVSDEGTIWRVAYTGK